MPAAAVIPAPIAYIKVAAVKKLVVVPKSMKSGSLGWCFCFLTGQTVDLCGDPLCRVFPTIDNFTLKKLECSKQAIGLNILAWNNGIGPRFYSVGLSNLGND